MGVIPVKLVLEGINRGMGIQGFLWKQESSFVCLLFPAFAVTISGFLLEFIPYSVTGQE